MKIKDIITENENPAQAWIDKVYKLYPQEWQNNHVMPFGDEQFAMFELVPSMSKRGAVEVKWFQAYPLRQGIGTRAMQELQRLAREDGIHLTLFPWEHGQVSQSKLTKFYKGQGFKPTMKGSKSMAWGPELSEDTVERDGVTIDYHWENGDLHVKALVDGRVVSSCRFTNYGPMNDPKWSGEAIFTDPAYRRQGMASILYNFGKEMLGTIHPTGARTKDGMKFWQKKKVWEDK